MRATLDALARFGDGLLTLATAVEGLAGRLRLRLRLRGAGLGVRLRTDLCTSKNSQTSSLMHASLGPAAGAVRYREAHAPLRARESRCLADLSARRQIRAQTLCICVVSSHLMLSFKQPREVNIDCGPFCSRGTRGSEKLIGSQSEVTPLARAGVKEISLSVFLTPTLGH